MKEQYAHHTRRSEKGAAPALCAAHPYTAREAKQPLRQKRCIRAKENDAAHKISPCLHKPLCRGLFYEEAALL